MRVSAISPIVAVMALCGATAVPASAHPGSGIVVDEKGQVFFTDTGNPDARFSGHVWKIDAQSRLSSAHAAGAHWLALDATGRFARADLKAGAEDRQRRFHDLGADPVAAEDCDGGCHIFRTSLRARRSPGAPHQLSA